MSKEPFTLRLPKQLLDAARRKAAAEGRTLSSLVEAGLRKVLDRERSSVRVSTATGGPRPGIDIVDTQEVDDIEYMERMKEIE